MTTQAIVKDKKFSGEELYSLIEATYPDPGYVVLPQLRDATGFDAVRTADAVAIGMYRSRGRFLHGFEIKVSRNDWIKELENPEKAESIMRFCHYWSLVVPDEKIVRPGELPPTWGLYVPGKKRLKAVVPPPEQKPVPIDMVMLTALIYGATCRAARREDQKLRERYEQGIKEGIERGERAQKELATLEAAVAAFENESGLSLTYVREPYAKQMGAAVRMVLQGNTKVKQQLGTMKYAVKSSRDFCERMEEQIAETEKLLLVNDRRAEA